MKTFFRPVLLVMAGWLFFQPDPLAAQHILGLSFGLEKTDLLDQNVSALPYQGFIPQLGLHWKNNGQRWQSGVDLSVGRGHLQAAGNEGRTVRFINEDIHGQRDTVTVPNLVSWMPVGASFQLLRTLTPLDQPWRVSAGGSIADQFFYADGFVRPGLMNIATLSPQMQMEYRPAAGRAFISVGVAVPLVAVVTRMRYDGTVSAPGGTVIGGFFDHTTWHSLDKYRQWTGFVALGYRFTSHLQAVLGYRFERRHDALPRPVDLQRQSLTAGIQWLY